jgi:gamma-glutamyltranspeptidase/glutathione hydrolase
MRLALLAVFVLLHATALTAANGRPRNTHGAVATVHPLATQAALEAVRRGGNAADAAIAAALALAVVDGHNSGLGGGCLILVRTPDANIVALDGRETAPAAATRDMFIRDGKAEPDLSQTGPLAPGVPGAVAAYHLLLQRYGRRPWTEHLEYTARLAERGFVLTGDYAARIKETARDLRRFPEASALLLDARGAPRQRGFLLRQPDLARTCRALAAAGPDWFYRGPFAQIADRWMRDHGGLLTAADFAQYQVKIREPVRSTYRGYDISGFPPPSSGGVHVAQILNLLERFDLKTLGLNSPQTIHLTAEAMKLAFADRAYWLGDPDFTPVPLDLAAKTYADRLASTLDPNHAAPVPSHGTPEAANERVFPRHTTHVSAADATGLWVALTTTLNTSFGSKVVVPGTGVFLNNQLDDFAAQPGATNYFGLVGANANAVAPGKRPLSSMSPTLVLCQGQPILAVGAAGGPTIISQTLLAILNTLDFSLDLPAALRQPRFHHQWRPDELRVEKRLPARTRDALTRLGHRLRVVRSLAATQAVAFDPQSGTFTAAHDPRVSGRAATW